MIGKTVKITRSDLVNAYRTLDCKCRVRIADKIVIKPITLPSGLKTVSRQVKKQYANYVMGKVIRKGDDTYPYVVDVEGNEYLVSEREIETHKK